MGLQSCEIACCQINPIHKPQTGELYLAFRFCLYKEQADRPVSHAA